MFYSFCTHRDIFRSEQPLARGQCLDFARPSTTHPNNHLQPCAHILAASGFSFNEAPAVGLGCLRAPLRVRGASHLWDAQSIPRSSLRGAQ